MLLGHAGISTSERDAARRELVAAHPSSHSVAKIALRNGFTHLGRFSVEFRERFGESPKQTLTRRAERREPAFLISSRR